MMITITNLFPRPDRPTRGLFNFELFKAMAASLPVSRFLNICLVPEWQLWRWPEIRRWKMPASGHIARATVYLPVFYLPLVGRSLAGWLCQRALKRFFSAGRGGENDGAPDVFLGSWLYPDAVAVVRLAAGRGGRAWMRVHGTDRYHLKHPVRRRLILDACRMAEGVICNCRAVAADLVKWGVPAGRLHIVPNGVDGAVFRHRTRDALLAEDKKGALSSFLNASSTDPAPRMVLFVGNLVPIKGPDVALKAFGRMATGGTSPVLVVIGIGPMRRRLERLARELGVAGRVCFLGARPHAEVALWMNRADVLCLASRSEGMPNVIVESLVSGLPVVATDVGACRELLADEPCARVCTPGDEADIARALEAALAADPDRRAMAARHGGRFSWAHQAETIAGLMAGRGAGGGKDEG
jgi:glycosyltransferase involved in cell wall biosynthesis